MKKNTIFLLYITLFFSIGISQRYFSDPTEIISFGINNSKEIQENKKFYQEKIKSAKFALEPFLPQIGINFSNSKNVPIESPDTKIKSINISINQKIYDNRKEELTYKYNKQNALMDYLTFLQSIKNFELEIIEKYYSLILQHKSIQLNEELLLSMHNELKIYEYEYNNGIGLKSDLIEYQISVNELNNKINDLKNEEENIKTDLLNILNINSPEEVIFTESNSQLKIEKEKIKKQQKLIEEKIITNDIELKKIDLETSFQKKQNFMNKLFFLPSISLHGEVSFSGNNFPLTQPTYSVSLVLSFDSLPFFPTNFSNSLSVNKKRINSASNNFSTSIVPELNYFSNQRLRKISYNQSLIIQENKLKELKKSTTQLINQHDSLIDFILLLTESIRLKEEKLSIIEYQSKNGLIKVSDYINEKINLNEAKINLLNQQINLLLIQKKLKILTGETKWKKDFY